MIFVRVLAVLALIPYVAGDIPAASWVRSSTSWLVVLPFSGVSVVGQLIRPPHERQRRLPARGRLETIRLRIRHVGFTPVDTQLVPSARTTRRAFGSSLPAFPRRWPRSESCPRAVSAAGRADGGGGDALPQVFEQLQLNAEQFRLVEHAVPVQLRRRTAVQPSRREAKDWETNPRPRPRSPTRWKSSRKPTRSTSRVTRGGTADKPGDIIVTSGVSALGVRYAVMIPMLAVFADGKFVKHHCFHDAGEATVDGQTFRRVDFKAAEDIRDPDIDGTMYLDPATYVIRRSVISLSKKSRYTSSYDSVVVETTFDELVSGVPVITWTRGRNALKLSRRQSSKPWKRAPKRLAHHQRRRAAAGSRDPLRPGRSRLERRGDRRSDTHLRWYASTVRAGTIE